MATASSSSSSSSQNQQLAMGVLGEMFLPPTTSNNGSSNRHMMESHSDTEVELGDQNDDHHPEGGSSSPSSKNRRSMSRSLSGELIVTTAALPTTTTPYHNHYGKPVSNSWVPPEEPHRAVHRIRRSALTHNYHQVEAAASRQKCSVITVVKADGYGHGAIATALHLADHCGADAFAVATLEEGIALRQAFTANPPGQWSKQLLAATTTAANLPTQHVHDPTTTLSSTAEMTAVVPPPSEAATGAGAAAAVTHRRPAQIRILVLGPPVGFPRCFDEYYHHNIEVMVSGPEVAASVIHWVADEAQRKRTAVERAANEAKYAALYSTTTFASPAAVPPPPLRTKALAPPETAAAAKKEEASVSTACSTAGSWGTTGSGERPVGTTEAAATTTTKALPHPSNTLGNVQGVELAREVRSLMLHQQEAMIRKQQQQQQQETVNVSAAPSIDDSPDGDGSPSGSPPPAAHKTTSTASTVMGTTVTTLTGLTNAGAAATAGRTVFGGIEAAARSSRHNEAAAARARAVLQEENDNDDIEATDSPVSSIAIPVHPPPSAPTIRKRLRWHALVDSGMGRLGFKTEIVSAHDKTGRRDTVAILKEMVDLELVGNAPLEFNGMCTHMADARDLSDYTNSQIYKFKALLKRVRAAGISVPTVSTDNSAALLTTSLKHFDPAEMLSQVGADSRGYVRTGGAIYGQRPSFPQLKAVSTLLASVRHVAILKKGDTVGYDRAYVAPHDVRIATLTIGFADGYPRELGNGVGKVQIRGALFPVAGNVCMDMMMVDLGPANEKTGTGAGVVVGDTAVLWGPLDEDVENGGDNQGMVRLQDIAATLKTTQSALTCGLDKTRVRRQFVQ